MYLEIRTVAARDIIAGILVRNGYTVRQVKIQIEGRKTKTPMLEVTEQEEADE